MSYYAFGDPEGAPVIAFHGIPSCGLGFDFADDAARARGVRLLAPDRPGVGRSSVVSGYTPAAYGAMVGEFADALGHDTFGVWGYSGGGPYACATAAVLGDRVNACAVAAGMGQIGVWASADDFAATDRQLFWLSMRAPLVASVILTAVARLTRLRPHVAYKSFLAEMGPADRPIVEAAYDNPADAVAQFTEAASRTGRGIVDDYRATSGEWGIDLSAITTPVRVYQGLADQMVPPAHSEALVERIDHAELVTWPGEGHLGPIKHADEIVAWLASQAT